jgi:hypothetical protein
MAAKPTSRSGQSRTRSSNKAKSSNRSSRSGGSAGAKARSGGSASTKARAARASSGSARAGSAAARRQAQAESAASRASNGFVGAIKQTASKAKGPAIAVGAAAVGAAGGALLRDRTRKKTVLGVPVPRSIGKSKAPDLDLPEMAKSIGRASTQFGQKTKSVSRDMERMGDRAERFGKMLS